MTINNIVKVLLLASLPVLGFASDFEGPITIKGKAFVYQNNDVKRFMIRGVALSGVDEQFQEGSKKDRTPNADDDLLSEEFYPYLERVILPKLQALNVNAIRVYRVDPSKNHDKSMQLLKDNGIYVLMEIMNNKVFVNRAVPSYMPALYKRVTEVVDAFHKYDNVLGFSVGNELVFPGNIFANVKHEDAAKVETLDAQIEKSLIRDTQAYIKSKGYRDIPVGVSMQDGPADSPEERNYKMIPTSVVASYYACKTDGVAADFIGINSYRYLPPYANAPKNDHAYDPHIVDVKNFDIPVIFTESGGQQRENGIPAVTRDWAIIKKEFNDKDYSNHLSGDFAFMLFETDEKYGLYVQQKDIDDAVKQTSYMDGKVTGGADNLGQVYAELKGVSVPMPAESVPDEPLACPANFNPPLLGDKIEVKLQNYADVEIAVVQGGEEAGVLAAAPSKKQPGEPITLKVLKDTEIKLQQKPNYWSVCFVPGKDVKTGITIKNNVGWGEKTNCNLK